MNSFPGSMTPRQMPKPSEFMLGPSDWRKNSNPSGGGSGKIFSKSERFPTTKCPFGECVAPNQVGTIAYNVKSKALNNPTAACFRAKTPQRPEPKRPLGDLVTSPGNTFGGARAKSPASSCFRSTSDRFSQKKIEGNPSLRESQRKDMEVLQYSGLPKWTKPAEKGRGDASMRSKSDRFKTTKTFAECYGNVPVVTARGQSASISKAQNRVSSWTKNSGHDTFLPG